MRKSKIDHPWRTFVRDGHALDLVAGTRSSEFAAYLSTLSRDERAMIETAERAFVLKTQLPSSRQQSTTVDYARGMRGVKEDEPVGYVGFVV